MEISYKNSLPVEDYISVRGTTDWEPLCYEQAEATVKSSAFIVSAWDGEYCVGIARVVWDGGYVAYLSDVVVRPEYQGLGIGRRMVGDTAKFVRRQLRPGWRIKLLLVAAKGKENFYEHFGFAELPRPDMGPGMDMWLRYGEDCAT